MYILTSSNEIHTVDAFMSYPPQAASILYVIKTGRSHWLSASWPGNKKRLYQTDPLPAVSIQASLNY